MIEFDVGRPVTVRVRASPSGSVNTLEAIV